jgi:prepilin-type N-terminal cleavage/methylation domain-containing protein
MKRPYRPYAGFTLLEMMLVISIITILAALAFPIMVRIKNQSDISSTKNLVTAIQTAIKQYRIETFTDTAGQLHRAWTLDWGSANTQQAIDGDPLLYQQFLPSNNIVTLAPATYRGLVVMAGLQLPQTQLDNVGRILDKWRQPLQIMYGVSTYGPDGFGVWSFGPDKISNTSDDIQSWTNNEP